MNKKQRKGVVMRAYLLGLMIGLCGLGVQAKTTSYGFNQKDFSCDDVVFIHSFLSSAQFTCGFQGYSEDLIMDAAQCSKKMSSKNSDATIKEGIKKFNDRVEIDGKKETCKAVLEKFPNVVRK